MKAKFLMKVQCPFIIKLNFIFGAVCRHLVVCYSQTLRRSTLVITVKLERQPSFHIKFTCLEKV